MNSIDQKVVEMKFDNTQFESAVAQTMSTLEKFKDKLKCKGTEKGISKLGKTTSDYQYTLQDVGQSLSNLEKRFSALGTIGGRIFENLTDSAYSFVTKGIGNIVSSITQGGMSRAMNLEQARFQMKGILQDTEKVHAVIYDYILPELQGTPYSLDQAAVVMGQLIASGKTNEEQIRRATRGIAGLAAMTGHSFEDVGRIFTKVAGNGVMMAQELNQLSGYGINAAADLAKFYNGVEEGSYKSTRQTLKDMAAIKEEYGEFTESVVREAASKRLITYGSMAAAMDALYGSHAQKSIQMYSGALDDLKAALARIGAEPATLKLNLMRDACNALVPAVDAVNAVIKPFWNSMRDLGDLDPELEYVAPFTGPLAKKVQEVGWAFQKLFVQLDENNEIIRVTKDSYKKLGITFDEVKNVYKDVETGLEYDEKQALMNPKMLATITNTTQSFVNVVAALGKALKAVGEGIKMAFPKVTFDQIVNISEQVKNFTSKLTLGYRELERIKWFVRGLFTPLGLAIRGLVGIINLLIYAFKSLSKVVTPVLSVFNSFMGMLGRIVSGLGNMVRNFTSILRGNIADATKEIRSAEKWGEILKKFTTTCHILAQNLDRAGIKAYAFLTHLHELPAVQTSLSSISTIVGGLKTVFDFVSKAVGDFVGKLGLNDKLTSFFNTLKDFFSAKGSEMAGSLSAFSDWFGKVSFFKSAVDLLTGSFTGLLGVMAGFAKYKPLKGIRKWFGELGQIIIDIGKSFLSGDFFVDRAKDAFAWFANYRRLGRDFKNGFLPAAKALGGALPKLLDFKDWGELLEAASKKFAAAFSFIMKTLGLFGTGVTQDAAKGVENLSKMTASIRASAKDLGDSQYITPLKMFFDKIGGSFKEWAQNMDVQSAKRLIIGLAYFGTCLYYLNTLNQAARAFRGLTLVAQNIGNVMGAIGKLVSSIASLPSVFKGVVQAVKVAGYMTALSIALIGIAASMYVISKIDKDRLVDSVGIIAGMLIAVAALMWGVNKVANKLGPSTAKTMLTIAGVIGSLALAVFTIAGSLYLLTGIEDPKALEEAVQSISNIILVFGLVMGALAALPLFTKGKKLTTKAFGNISSAAWALVGIAAGIRSMVEAIKGLAELYQNGDEDAIKKAVDLVNHLIILTGVFALLAGWGKHGFASGMAIIPLALGLKILVGTLIDLANTLKDAESLDRAMKALDGLGKFISNLAWLFIAIAAMNALSGVVSRGDFVFSGKGSLGGALLLLAEVIAGVWVVGQAMMQLGTLTDAQIENGIKVLKAFGLLAGVIAGLSYFGGNKVAAGAASFGALAAGLFLLAEGIVALGETEHFAAGFARMALALLGLIGAVALVTALLKEIIDPKAALAIGALALSMLGFALSIRMMAELPWESLAVSIVGLVLIMASAAAVLSAFALAGPELLPIAAVFALLGVASLGLGAGIFLLILALSALLPLIVGVGQIPLDQLESGLLVLKEAAKGLCEVFETLAGGLVTLAGGFLLLGAALLIAGVGGVALGAGLVAVSIGVFLLAGSFIVLYEVLASFFPSVVKPVENGLASLASLFGSEIQRAADEARYGIESMHDGINEEGEEMIADADRIGEETANSINPANHTTQTDVMQELAETYGVPVSELPGDLGSMIDKNSGEFTGSISDMLGTGNIMLSNSSAGTGAYGLSYVSNYGSGITKGSNLPINSTSGMLSKISTLHQKYQEMANKAGAAQSKKFGEGISSGEEYVKGASYKIAQAGVPPDKSGAAKSVGLSMAEGLAAGIRSGAQAVYDIAATVAANAAASMKKGADVNSPSKKTIPVGSALGEGLIVGMQNIASKVMNTSEELASDSVNALTSAMMSASAAFDSDLDFNPTITPVVDLTGVRQSVNGINDMFGRDFYMNSAYAGGINAALAARSFADSRNQNGRKSELAKLTDSIYGMTETMNSRSLNNYINIDGAGDPEAFADGLIRSFKLNARTV